MSRYIVTSGSHFQPFTYDELVKPLQQMTDAQRAAENAYAELDLETNAIGQYITDNPEDAKAKKLYDTYKQRLSSLQDNLWNNGFTPNTSRDIANARAAYADVAGIKNAIQNRQQRSKEYWDMRHKNPDLVAGKDPGTFGLDRYLGNDTFGQDWYSYSGDKFASEVAADAKARADELLNEQTDIYGMKKAEIPGYLISLKRNGFTSDEVSKANALVDQVLAGDINRADITDNSAEGILANVLLNHLDSTGAKGQLDANEFNRLVNYGKSGLSQSIGKVDTQLVQDLEYKYEQDLKKAREIARISNSGKKEETPNTSVIDTWTRTKPGDNYDAAVKRYESKFGKKFNTLFGRNGEEIKDGAQASEYVYSGDLRREYARELGFDIGRTPKALNSKDALGGEKTIVDSTGTRRIIETRYDPKRDVVVWRPKGNDMPWDSAYVSKEMTDKYHEGLALYDENREWYKANNRELYSAARVNPDDQYKLYKEDEIPSGTPLTGYANLYFSKQENNPANRLVNYYVARNGTDPGKYVARISGYVSTAFPTDLKYDVDAYKGTTNGIHKVNESGALSNESYAPTDVFTYDANGNITNIKDVSLSGNSLLDDYIEVRTDKGDFSIGIPLLRSDEVKRAIMNAQYAIAMGANEDNVIRELILDFRDLFGYDLSTQSQGGTAKDNNN